MEKEKRKNMVQNWRERDRKKANKGALRKKSGKTEVLRDRKTRKEEN